MANGTVLETALDIWNQEVNLADVTTIYKGKICRP